MHKLNALISLKTKLYELVTGLKVIFSDGKKINLDDLDGFKYYWHHVNKDEISYSKRIRGGGGIVVWASFCSSEQLILQVVSNEMNNITYCKMLEISLLAFFESKNSEFNDVGCDLNYIF